MIAKENISTSVLIAGAGPVGMALAIELGRRGVECVLINDQIETSHHPKANAISSRSMEHFRRMGIAKSIRKSGLDDDHPTDVAYFTSLNGYEIGRLEQPSRRDAMTEVLSNQGSWASPEPPHRSSQIFLEIELKKKVDSLPSVEVLFGYRLTEFVEIEGSIHALVEEVRGVNKYGFKARYMVGCDGPTSVVRKTLGIEYEGESGVVRPMFGGPMYACYFQAKDDLSWLCQRKAWQYWIVNPEIRAVLVHIDSKGKFVIQFAINDENERKSFDAKDYIFKAVGREFELEIISTVNWTGGYSLVAQRYRKGNIFIAGDAAHLFTPTGGMGMNTGVDDAVNLGWKLGAVINGWADPDLLKSYEIERRPIGVRNVGFARAFAESVGTVQVGAGALLDNPAGGRERDKLSNYLERHASNEFIIPGIFLGLNYSDSPIIVYDDNLPILDNPNAYEPNPYPGSRAPHAWFRDRALFDRFGPEYTLLDLNNNKTNMDGLSRDAEAAGIPLTVLRVADNRIKQLYGCSFALIRPDQHVAWRGNVVPKNWVAILKKITGSI